MDQLKVFDRALLGKQIAGNGVIVIIDVIYLIVGVVFGSWERKDLIGFILFCNILATCILYHNFLITKGDMKLELITQKVLFYPTTRYQFLWNKYAKTLFFLLIQAALTLACFGLGYYGNRGSIDGERIILGLLAVFVSILLTSGAAILLVHMLPMGIYLSMVLFYPLYLMFDKLGNYIGSKDYVNERLTMGAPNLKVSIVELAAIGVVVLLTTLLWIGLLWLGVKIYEKIN